MDDEKWKNFSDEVKSRTKILDVVSPYVGLEQRGHRYWGLCPFHEEKTPSFTIDPEKNLFYCFGCQVGGNAFKFLSLIENITYGKAIELQAIKLGINFKDTDNHQSKLIERFYIAVGRASKYYRAVLATKYGRKALEYLQSRGVTSETIHRFDIGFAPDSWDALLTSSQKAGVSRDLLVRAGLILQSKKNPERYYDRFRNRVMIPISDDRGRVVGFGARSIDGSEPKYLNSSDSEIFNKRKIVYGLDRAKKTIGRLGYAIICEGYMDAISVSSSGIENVVATLGTAFTSEQAELLSKYTKTFYFCYDSDSAGQKATIRAISIAEEKGVEVKVIQIPDSKDPDEYIRKNGAEEFQKLIKKSQTSFEYQMEQAIENSKDVASIEGRAKIIRKLLPILQRQKPIEKSEYIKKMANRLYIEEGTIAAELERIEGCANRRRQKDLESTDNAIIAGSRYILSLLLDNPEMCENVRENLPEGMEKPEHREIFQQIEKGEGFERMSAEARAELTKITRIPINNKIKAYQESLTRLRVNYLKKLKHRRMLEKNYDEAGQLQKEINDLNAEFEG